MMGSGVRVPPSASGVPAVGGGAWGVLGRFSAAGARWLPGETRARRHRPPRSALRDTDSAWEQRWHALHRGATVWGGFARWKAQGVRGDSHATGDRGPERASQEASSEQCWRGGTNASKRRAVLKQPGGRSRVARRALHSSRRAEHEAWAALLRGRAKEQRGAPGRTARVVRSESSRLRGDGCGSVDHPAVDEVRAHDAQGARRAGSSASVAPVETGPGWCGVGRSSRARGWVSQAAAAGALRAAICRATRSPSRRAPRMSIELNESWNSRPTK